MVEEVEWWNFLSKVYKYHYLILIQGVYTLGDGKWDIFLEDIIDLGKYSYLTNKANLRKLSLKRLWVKIQAPVQKVELQKVEWQKVERS